MAGFFKILNPQASLLIFFAVGVLVKNIKNPSASSSHLKIALTTIILFYCLFISSNHTAYNFTSCVFIGAFLFDSNRRQPVLPVKTERIYHPGRCQLQHLPATRHRLVFDE